ncbi:hypothetical protein HYU23_00200 [Candidatus Woesearchaeota archaeon]|nr:hypothetical protein [Candidatus Woesearchaeota archaeon]
MARGERFFIFIILLLLILASFVYSQNDTTTDTSVTQTTQLGYDQAKSYGWLYTKVKNATFSVDQRALSTISLLQNSQGEMAGLIEALKDSEDRINNCWPNGACKVKDTALAALALALAGQDVTKEVAWLKNAKIPALSTGEWWVVVKSGANANGSCQFSYKGGSKTFDLQDDKIKLAKGGFTSGQYYINLNELSPTLKTAVQPEITVGCDPGLNSIITLIYKPNPNTFFIQRSDPAANLQLKVANACYGNQVPASSCSYDSTAYATWALLEIASITGSQDLSLENIGTHIYLENQAITKSNDPIALGLLNRILIKSGSSGPSFISGLVKLQRLTDGSWGGDITTTSIASFGLTGSDKSDSVAKGISYLVTKVGKDGSWNSNVESTSWALIALHGGELSRFVVSGGTVPISDVEVCGNGVDDDHDGADDCAEKECLSDPVCQCVNNIKDGDENGIDCGGSCPQACEEEIKEDDITEPAKEEPQEKTEPEVTEEEEGSLWWLWLIIILVLIGGGYFFYVKYVKTGKIDLKNLFKKKPKGPSFEDFRRQAEFKPIQPQRPLTQARPVQKSTQPAKPMAKAKSKEEEELEKSMREAEKLLKG